MRGRGSQRALGLGLALTLGACSSVTVDGRVVDGLTGQPIGSTPERPYKIRAKAANAADVALTCQFFDAPVGADGTFKLERLCNGTGYHLETDRDDLWLVEIDEIPDGGFGQPTDITAWRVPKGSGVYKLSDGELTMLRTATEVESDQIFNSSESVRLPHSLPDRVDLIGKDEHLVLVGKATIDEMKLWPLIESPPRRFGDPKGRAWRRPDSWWYLGTRFIDDEHFERVEAKLDPAGVVDKIKGERAGRFIASTALPAGRYALLKDDDKRMYLVDFGVSQTVPAPAPAPTP
jgi:hypothetical protein